METQLLKNMEIFPSGTVLKEIMGDNYPVFEYFSGILSSLPLALTLEWHYYNDGKAWLGKVLNKKKTVCWLSVWEGYFKVSFFFTAKHLEGIAALNIEESIKEDFCRNKPIGKLMPMIFKIDNAQQISELLKVIEFKKNLK